MPGMALTGVPRWEAERASLRGLLSRPSKSRLGSRRPSAAPLLPGEFITHSRRGKLE
jgi:hypothetical protein